MNETTLAKIAITSTADEALTMAVEQVNKGFEGGRVTKADLASWLIIRSAGSLNDSVMEDIRRAHFNQVIYLESLVKKLKSSGRDNLEGEELTTLQAMLGQQTTKKRARLQKEESRRDLCQGGGKSGGLT